MTVAPESSENPQRKLRLAWFGLPLVLVGCLSYFLFFALFPITRDFPWLNLILIGIGLTFAWRSFAIARETQRRGHSVWHGLLLTASALFAGLFLFYVFYISYQIPQETATTKNLAASPEFALTAHDGSTVRLEDFRGRYLILSFYRGHW